jgi:SNF2 family DNA or RNA helicase
MPPLHLEISVAASGNILISRRFHGEDEVWAEVVSWWKSALVDSNSTSLDSELELTISQFTSRKKWLRNYWLDFNRTVEVEPSVQIALRIFDVEREAFEKLAYSESAISSSEIVAFKPRLIRPLTEFQKRNVLSILRTENGANFSVPGSGKTATELVVFSELVERGIVDRMLVICPRSGFEAWQNEPSELFEKPMSVGLFSTDSIPARTDILVTNYEQLENEEKLSRLLTWLKANKSMLVIDEAHRIKGGASSVRWRACRKLAAASVRVDILTGTPLPQGFDDLTNLLTLTWQNIPADYFSHQNLQKLKRGGIFVRTTKEELELPPLTIKSVSIPMGEIQTQIYSALGKQYNGLFSVSEGDSRYFQKKGRAVFSLLGAATNPGLLMGSSFENAYLNLVWPPKEISENPWLREIVDNYSRHEIPPKYIWISNFIKDRAPNGVKVIIWSNFIGNLKGLERILAPFNPLVIYGATTQDERKRLLKLFRQSPDFNVLISNPQTLGEGISLHQVCHEAVYVDRSYNAGEYLQSLDRIHRLGLDPAQETYSYVLQSERSIDERVQARLNSKIKRLAKMMNDSGLVAGSIPDTEDGVDLGLAGLDQTDIDDLLSHLGGLT